MPLQAPIFYQGRFNRGLDDSCPPDHAIDELNIAFSHKSCGSRYGFESHLAAAGTWNGHVLRVHVYERVGEATRLLILDDSNNIWDSTSFASPILTFGVAVTDFAMRTIYNRAYISPHNGTVGTTGEYVYVYDGTGTARLASGSAPSGHTLAGADGAAGDIEIGHHLFAVCFETASGHITNPGLTGTEVLNYNAPGSKKCDLSGIPTGPAGTVGRYIVGTAVLGETYNGNPTEQEWFFIPDGHIADNTTTTLTVNFFDEALLETADYLQYQKAKIPAGCALLDFNNRLVVVGDPANASKPWVGNDTEPESISELDGYLIVDPGDGGGCKNGVSNRGLLYITKSQRIFSTSDNGAAPSTWKVDRVDAAFGAEPNGVGKIGSAQGANQDTIFMADRTGLYMYPNTSETKDPITWKIDDDWGTINQNYFYKVQIYVDPMEEVIYCAVPLGSATAPSAIFIGDYKMGLDKDSIRWSKWTMPSAPTSIWVDTDSTTKLTNFRYGSVTGSIYKYSTTRSDYAGANVIDSYAQFGYYPEDSGGYVNQMTDIRMRVLGYGSLSLTTYTLDSIITVNLTALGLSSAPGKELIRGCNLVSEKGSVKIRVATLGYWFQLYYIRYNTGPVWFDRSYA